MFELFDINFYYAKEQESRDSKLFTLDDVIKEGGGTPLLSIDMFLPEKHAFRSAVRNSKPTIVNFYLCDITNQSKWLDMLKRVWNGRFNYFYTDYDSRTIRFSIEKPCFGGISSLLFAFELEKEIKSWLMDFIWRENSIENGFLSRKLKKVPGRTCLSCWQSGQLIVNASL